MNFEVDRDEDLRGYWVKGLRALNELCREYAVVDDDEFFVPDRLLFILGEEDATQIGKMRKKG